VWPAPADLGYWWNNGAAAGASVAPPGEGNGGGEWERHTAAAGGGGAGERLEWAAEMAGEKIRPSWECGGGCDGGGGIGGRRSLDERMRRKGRGGSVNAQWGEKSFYSSTAQEE
jgi:hypothetical protein